MLIGGITWLAGELWGVWRNAHVKNPGNDTTSQFVWLAERKWPLVRILVAVFVVSLLGHFEWHYSLLP